MIRSQLPLEPPCEWCGLGPLLWSNGALICPRPACQGPPLVPIVDSASTATTEEES